MFKNILMAEKVGFEPTRRVDVLTHFECVPFSQAWVLLRGGNGADERIQSYDPFITSVEQ